MIKIIFIILLGADVFMSLYKRVRDVVLTIILILTVIISTYIFVNNINAELNRATVSTLHELAQQQIIYIENEMRSEITVLNETIARVMDFGFDGEEWGEKDEIAEFLRTVEINSDLENITVSKKSGEAVTSSGAIVDVSYLDFFYEVLDGTTYYSDLIMGSSVESAYLHISKPIYDNYDKLLGIIVADIPSSFFDEMLFTTYESEGFTLLFDGKGNAIATTENNGIVLAGDNLFEEFEEIGFVGGVDTEQLQNLLVSGESGNLSYSIDGVLRELTFEPVEGTNWYLVVSVPSNVIARQAYNVLLHTFLLFVEFSVIAVVLFIRFRDIKKNHLVQIEKIAYYDDLTALPNMKKLKQKMEQILTKAPQGNYVIMKLDIVNFNIINKLFGFEVGDEVLKIIGEFGEKAKGKDYIFARVGTDEFMVFGTVEALKKANSERAFHESVLKEKIPIASSYDIKFRYSRYIIPKGMTDINEILDNIIMTHNYAKSQNTTDIVNYNKEIKEQIIHNTYICSIMHEALNNEEFIVYLQPKNSLDDLSICGAEALVRWRRPDGAFIFPNEFIPIFEEDGFIVELDKYMLKRTCQIIRGFMDIGRKPIPVSINFSRLHMLNTNFVEEVVSIVDSYQVPRNLIEIEITETALLEDEQAFRSLFTSLHESGFTLSMDDFGEGYSSFGLLQTLEFDVLKIDKSLLSAENLERRNFVIETIIEMCRKLKLKTVCEGVETEEQVEFLKSVGCDIAQGYYFAKPMPNEEFDSMLKG